MAFTPKDNSGALFVNDRKEKDTHPDRTGTALIGGVEYYVSGWIKSGSNGQFLSMAFKPKDAATAPAPPASGRAIDDDIPF